MAIHELILGVVWSLQCSWGLLLWVQVACEFYLLWQMMVMPNLWKTLSVLGAQTGYMEVSGSGKWRWLLESLCTHGCPSVLWHAQNSQNACQQVKTLDNHQGWTFPERKSRGRLCFSHFQYEEVMQERGLCAQITLWQFHIHLPKAATYQTLLWCKRGPSFPWHLITCS